MLDTKKAVSSKEIATDILRYCKNGYMQLTELMKMNNYAKTTFYRILNKLVKDGLIESLGGKHKTTQKELNQIAGVNKADSNFTFLDSVLQPILEKVPHFKWLPTPIHKAISVTILGAAKARECIEEDSAHAVIAIVGPTFKWKTTTCEIICHTLNLNVDDTIVLLSAESGKSMFLRRNSKGDIATARKVLSSPIVVLDEYNKCEKRVKAAIHPILHGKRTLPFENDTIKISATPVILSNPLKNGTIFEKLGIDEPAFRRMICCDLTNIEIPESIKLEGDNFIKEVKSLGALESCEPLPGEDFNGISKIKAVVTEAVAHKEDLRLIDCVMIANVAKGISGYIGKTAVKCALACYLAMSETIGFIKPSWPQILHKHFPDSNRSSPVQSIADSPASPISSFKGSSIFSYSEKIREVEELLSEMDLTPAQAVDALNELKEIKDLKAILTHLGFNTEWLKKAVLSLSENERCRTLLRNMVWRFKNEHDIDVVISEDAHTYLINMRPHMRLNCEGEEVSLEISKR